MPGWTLTLLSREVRPRHLALRPARRPSRPHARQASLAGLPWIAAGLIAAASLTWAILRQPAPAPASLVVRAQTVLKDRSLFIAVSNDGTRMAFTTAQGAGSGLTLRMLDQFAGKIIPGSDGALLPLFSPDGEWIAYTTTDQPRKIRKIPITGGTSITICDGSFFDGGTWGPDDTIVFSGPKGLLQVPAGGGAPQELTTVDTAKGEVSHGRPQFLPGGKQILFTINGSSDPQFAVLDLATGKYTRVAKGGTNGRYAPSGHLTYVRDATLFALPFDLARLQVTGPEVPVVEGVSTVGPDGTADYAFSDNGLLAYIGGDVGNVGTTLVWADRSGTTHAIPGESQQLWGTGRLSPDGRLIGNGIKSGQNTDIWVYDVERGTPTRLTFGGDNDTPVFSPDGKRVVYSAAGDGKFGLYVVPVDGSGRPSLVLSTPARPTPTSFTPDGHAVLYDMVGPTKQRQIFVLPLPVKDQPAEAHPLHDAVAGEMDGQVSPDGRWVAYRAADSGSPEIYVQPFPGPGPKTRISTDLGVRPRWSHNGRELFYWGGSSSGRLMAVDTPAGATFQPGEPHVLFQNIVGTTWDVTPDANRFLIELPSQAGGTAVNVVTNWFEELHRRAPARK